MKYTKILTIQEADNKRYVCLERACRTCNNVLKGDEIFCPQCGHKLIHIQEEVLEDFIIEALNGRSRTLSVVTGEADKGYETSVKAKNDPNVSCGDPSSSSGESHYEPKCPHGFDKGTCRHCTPNGACDMLICPTMPPQYQMCPFHGDGFIFCKDA